jgi:hypothetical protein
MSGQGIPTTDASLTVSRQRNGLESIADRGRLERIAIVARA